MSNTTIVVDTVTLEFMNMWPSDTANPPIVIGPNPQVSLETSEDPTVLMAVRDPETGEITLQADPQKIEDHKAALWSQLRTERNRRLAASDWTQLADAHLSQEKKDAWAAYRQELRDLPDEVTDEQVTSSTNSVPWPLDPTQAPVVPVAGSRLDGILGQV